MGRPRTSWLGQLDQTFREELEMATRYEGPPWLEVKGGCGYAPPSASAPLMMMRISIYLYIYLYAHTYTYIYIRIYVS